VEATLDASYKRGNMREPQSVDDASAVDHTARSVALGLLPEIAAKAL